MTATAISYYIFTALILGVIVAVFSMGYIARQSYADFVIDCPYCMYFCP